MRRSYVFGIATVLIWSTMAAMVKILLNNVPNFEVLSVSSLFAFLFLLLVNIVTGKIKEIKKYRAGQILIMAGLGFLGLFLYSALYYQGLSILSSQEACILNYLWPIMLVLFLTVILKEKITGIKVFSLLCSFAGVIILSVGPGMHTGESRWVGILCCTLAAVCYGLFSVLNKKINYDRNITMMMIWLTVTVDAPIWGRFTETWTAIRGTTWIGILWLGIAVDAAAYLLWALALRDAENTAVIANLAYLTPFISLIVSAVFLREQIGLNAAAAVV